MFIGRTHERSLLEERYHSDRSELLVLYGRRRIGKSSLVREFIGKKEAFKALQLLESWDKVLAVFPLPKEEEIPHELLKKAQ